MTVQSQSAIDTCKNLQIQFKSLNLVRDPTSTQSFDECTNIVLQLTKLQEELLSLPAILDENTPFNNSLKTVIPIQKEYIRNVGNLKTAIDQALALYAPILEQTEKYIEEMPDWYKTQFSVIKDFFINDFPGVFAYIEEETIKAIIQAEMLTDYKSLKHLPLFQLSKEITASRLNENIAKNIADFLYPNFSNELTSIVDETLDYLDASAINHLDTPYLLNKFTLEKLEELFSQLNFCFKRASALLGVINQCIDNLDTDNRYISMQTTANELYSRLNNVLPKIESACDQAKQLFEELNGQLKQPEIKAQVISKLSDDIKIEQQRLGLRENPKPLAETCYDQTRYNIFTNCISNHLTLDDFLDNALNMALRHLVTQTILETSRGNRLAINPSVAAHNAVRHTPNGMLSERPGNNAYLSTSSGKTSTC